MFWQLIIALNPYHTVKLSLVVQFLNQKRIYDIVSLDTLCLKREVLGIKLKG